MIRINWIGKIGLGVILIGVIFLGACTQKTTAEQREKFERCRKSFIKFNKRLKSLDLNTNPSKKDKEFIDDVIKMELDEILEKYRIETEDIDDFISSICVTNEIESAFEKLNRKLELSDEIIQNKDSILNYKIDSFQFNKI